MSQYAQDVVNAKLAPIRRAERRAEAVSHRAKLMALPGYLPVAKRPKCVYCGKRLPIYPWSSDRARYGYNAHGVFCSLSCGYYYGLAAAGGGKT